MQIIVITIAAFGGLMGLMALGVVLSKRPLKGSCGGVNGDCLCERAGKPGACDNTNQDDDQKYPHFHPPGTLMGIDITNR